MRRLLKNAVKKVFVIVFGLILVQQSVFAYAAGTAAGEGRSAGDERSMGETPAYEVVLEQSEGGTLKDLSGPPDSGENGVYWEGDAVQVGVYAEAGYAEEIITVSSGGGQVDYVYENGVIHFTMPAGNVQVAVVFQKLDGTDAAAKEPAGDGSASGSQDPEASGDAAIDNGGEAAAASPDGENGLADPEKGMSDDADETGTADAGETEIADLVESAAAGFGAAADFVENAAAAISLEDSIMPLSVGSVTSLQVKYFAQADDRYSIFQINGGTLAFCVEHGNTAPPEGTELLGEEESFNDNLRRVLWYGYQGPGSNLGDRSQIEAEYITSSAASNANGHGYINWTSTNAAVVWYNQIVNLPAPPAGFHVYIVTTASNYQNLAYSVYRPTGYLKLVKKSANTSITDGNAMYSLQGAQYGIYDDAGLGNQVGTLTVEAGGESNTVELNEGTYYLKELSAPKGYALDGTAKSVSVTSEQTTVFQAEDAPQAGTAAILLKKTDKETGQDRPQGAASFAGAEFTVKYYDGLYDAGSLSGKKALRTWVFRADPQGAVQLADSYKVSGDELYRNVRGVPVIPLGTVTVQETKAPAGYLTNGELFIRQIKGEGTQEDITSYSQITVPEQVIRGDVEIIKLAGDKQEEQAAMRGLSGAVFTFTSKTTGQVAARITTDERGFATTHIGGNAKGTLPYDTYHVEETTVPKGYAAVDPFEVTIREEGVTLRGIYLEDELIVSPISVVKTDSTTGETIPAAGTAFRLLNEQKEPVTVKAHYPAEQVYDTFTTDENGQFVFPEKLPTGVYYLEEVTAPEGYLLGEPLQFEIREAADWEHPLIVKYEDAPAMGRIEIGKTDAGTKDPVADAVFEISAAEDIVTPDGTVRLRQGEVADTVVTGEDGMARTKELFLGSYLVKEVRPAGGYLLSDEEYKVSLAYEGQETAVVTESLTVENRPNELRIVKKQKGTDQPLGGVKFQIWQKDMEAEHGEDSLLKEYVTDENGEITLNYLHPGTYCVQETEPLFGYLPVEKVFEFTVTEDGRIEGQDVYELTIENETAVIVRTMARDLFTDSQDVLAEEDLKIVDHVEMKGLIPGCEYILRGEGMDPEAKTELQIDGKPLSGEMVFTAKAQEQTVDVEFDFDGSSLGGRDIVFFENLYAKETDADEPGDTEKNTPGDTAEDKPEEQPGDTNEDTPDDTSKEVLLASHEDFNNLEQTISVEEKEAPVPAPDAPTPQRAEPVQTSDPGLAPYILMLAGGCVLLTAAVAKRRKSRYYD